MRFWHYIYGWSLALGFILVIAGGVMTYFLVQDDKFKNPAAPFIRAFERWQEHHHRMTELQLRAKMINAGIDQEYVQFMEKRMHDSR